MKAVIAVVGNRFTDTALIEGLCDEVSLSIIKASISIGKIENTIRNSLNRSDLSGGGIGRSESAIERDRKMRNLSIDSVTYKQIHSVVVCI